jgi:hypothetical protein
MTDGRDGAGPRQGRRLTFTAEPPRGVGGGAPVARALSGGLHVLDAPGDPVDVNHGDPDERRDGDVTAAGDARRTRSRRMGRPLPMDCPYCRERLDDAPRGWVCRRCRSTVGAELETERTEEGL